MAQGKPSRAGEKRQYCDGDRGPGKPPCRRPAGWGTNHRGIGYCKNHGGSTPNHQLAAVPAMASAFGNRVQVPIMSPRDTLVWLIEETTREVAFYDLQVSLLGEREVWGYHEAFVDRPRKIQKGAESKDERVQETRTSEPRLHIWINARASASDRLARYIKMAADIGIAEREIQLAERHGATIANMLSVVIEGLGLTDAQRDKAPEVIEGAMRELEAGRELLAA